MKIPAWVAPLAVVIIMAVVAYDLTSGVRHTQLSQSGDSLDTVVDSLAEVIDSLRRDTVVVTRIVRIADSSSHRARQAEARGDTGTASTHWRDAYESEHAAYMILESQVATYRNLIVPNLQGQLATALQQRESWRREARPSLFSLKRIRPVAGCVTNFARTTCGVGLGYSF